MEWTLEGAASLPSLNITTITVAVVIITVTSATIIDFC
jgi:hypothetical protein